jgi:hypothetical protein
MAKTVTLVHPNETVQVPGKLLVSKCDLFAEDPGLAAVPYHVQSRVSVSDFREFVSALQGTTVKVTNNNFKGLSLLCDEFHFTDFTTTVTQFKSSSDFKEDAVFLSGLEDRMRAHDDGIGALQAELLRQIQVQESLEQRIRTEAESASHRTNEIEKHVAEVESEVEALREALREVKEMAEGAQEKAALAEAQLARMGRLEAKVSGEKTTPFVPGPDSRDPAPTTFSASAVFPPPSGWTSAIVSDFPKLFEDFKEKSFTLLWRGSRDGFGGRDFHIRWRGSRGICTPKPIRV